MSAAAERKAKKQRVADLLNGVACRVADDGRMTQSDVFDLLSAIAESAGLREDEDWTTHYNYPTWSVPPKEDE